MTLPPLSLADGLEICNFASVIRWCFSRSDFLKKRTSEIFGKVRILKKTELPVRREAGCVVLAIPDKKMNVSKI